MQKRPLPSCPRLGGFHLERGNAKAESTISRGGGLSPLRRLSKFNGASALFNWFGGSDHVPFAMRTGDFFYLKADLLHIFSHIRFGTVGDEDAAG